MVLVKLQGGLGNQMFQFAVANEFTGKGKRVYLDHHFLESNQNDTEHFTARRYELGVFKNNKLQKAKPWQIALFTSHSYTARLWRRLFRSSFRYIKQADNGFINLTDLAALRHLYLDGYFQSEQYFKNSRRQILEIFQFPELDSVNILLKNRISNATHSVSIHIRRGDYLKSSSISDIHGVLPLSYYQNAVSLLAEKYDELTLFIFSDDIGWVKRNFEPGNFEHHYIDHNSASSWKDMALMSCCKHHIVANSSFSWWGAWLSTSGGQVFAPRKWFNPDKVKFDANDFIPKHWMILTHD